MKIITTLSIITVVIASDSHLVTPYKYAPDTITLQSHLHTQHFNSLNKPQIICENINRHSCPKRIHCYRPRDTVLNQNTKWTCDIPSKIWKVKTIRWQEAPFTTVTNDTGYIPNTFHAIMIQPYARKEKASKNEILLATSSIALLIGLLSILIDKLGLDIGSVFTALITVACITSYFSDDEPWVTQTDIDSEYT